jgi:hypothetical protein
MYFRSAKLQTDSIHSHLVVLPEDLKIGTLFRLGRATIPRTEKGLPRVTELYRAISGSLDIGI